jgi:hypothetical protein
LRPNHCATAVACRQQDLAEAGRQIWARETRSNGFLDAIENQLQAADPQLMDGFSALASVTPRVRLVNGWRCAAPYRKEAPRGRRRRTGRQAYAIVIELVLVTIAVVLVAMFLVGAVWVLIALSH